jgi:hypothetical protein
MAVLAPAFGAVVGKCCHSALPLTLLVGFLMVPPAFVRRFGRGAAAAVRARVSSGASSL